MDFSNIDWPEVCFVTGIGTDIGKTYATGWLAKKMREAGINVITQKFIQTGSEGISIDIEKHRKIMGIPLQTVDLTGITAPLSYTYPASPHLAAKIDNRPLKTELATEATRVLLEQYSSVLIEGAGGLMVPISDSVLTIDYIAQNHLPAILVTNGQLGSISDTLLSLQAMKVYHIKIFAVIYNFHFDTDKIIADDARIYMRNWVEKHLHDTLWLEMDK